jgi:hypothetical protein
MFALHVEHFMQEVQALYKVAMDNGGDLMAGRTM